MILFLFKSELLILFIDILITCYYIYIQLNCSLQGEQVANLPINLEILILIKICLVSLISDCVV